jgi:hypothetical protein
MTDLVHVTLAQTEQSSQTNHFDILEIQKISANNINL